MGISRYPAFPAPSPIEGDARTRLGRETRRETAKSRPTDTQQPFTGNFQKFDDFGSEDPMVRSERPIPKL
jgi:hypothetical protein